jgi:hypothetical protein
MLNSELNPHKHRRSLLLVYVLMTAFTYRRSIIVDPFVIFALFQDL